MRRTFLLRMLIMLGILIPILISSSVRAEQQPERRMPALSGNIEAGFRSVDVEGSENKFRQHFNLDTGPRLLNFSLNGHYQASNLLDRFQLQLNNLGGDPYERYSLRVQKDRLYSFEGSFRKSDYFYNAGNDLHTFDTRRENTDFKLTIKPEDWPKLTFGYSRLDKKGTTLLTFPTLTPVLPPPIFSTPTPIDETENYFFASAEFSLSIFDFFLQQDYRKSETSLNFFSTDPTFLYNSEEVQKLKQPTSRVKVHTLLFDSLDISSAFLYSKSEFDVDLNRQQDVSATTGDGSVDKKIWIWDLEASYPLLDSLTLHGLGQLSRVNQDGDIFFPGPAIQGTQTGKTLNKISTESFGFEFEYFPINTLTLTAGLKRQLREIEYNRQNHIEPYQDKEKSSETLYILGFNFKPLASLDLMGRFLIGDLRNPYTNISTTDTENIKLRLKYRALKNLTITATHAEKDTENDQTNFKSRSISDGISIAYQPVEKLDLNLGYTVQKGDIFSFFPPLLSPGAYTFLGSTGQYSTDSHVISGNALYAITSKLKAGIDIRNLDSSGTLPLHFSNLGVFLGYLWPYNLESKLRYQLTDYDEDLADANDYISNMVTLSLSLNF